MNIFEQYGIKEVADVTLYEITYDKYGDEVYIPIIYFDTLKVSSVEQAAQQTSAKGGLGNVEHVIWDHSKEITVELQDALYTPASQSLLWGGKNALKKLRIKGFYDPFVYTTKDANGNSIYLEKIVAPAQQNDEDIAVLCPCEEGLRYVHFEIAPHQYKHEIEPIIKDDDSYSLLTDNEGRFNSTEITRNGKDVLMGEDLIPIYPWFNFKSKRYKKDGAEIEEVTIQNINEMADLLEKAELIVTNFEDFKYSQYQIAENEENFTIAGQWSSGHMIQEYEWDNCEVKLVGCAGAYQFGLGDNVNICYHSFFDNNNKRIIFKDEKGKYYSHLDLFYTAKKIIPGADGEDHIIRIPVPMGTFYIVEDFNIPNITEEYTIDKIEYSVKDTKFIERMEELNAFQQFAIDVDKNIQSYNYSLLPQHSQNNLTVYYNPKTQKPYEPNDHYFTKKNGEVVTGNFYIFKPGELYRRWTRRIAEPNQALGRQITITSKDFPGVFKLVGETYIRDRHGFDERYQIEIPLCKLKPGTNITLQADGGPTTVDMSLKALRLDDGTLMRLTSYNTKKTKFDGNCSNSTEIVPFDILETITCTFYENEKYTLTIVAPAQDYIYCVGKDCRISSYDTDNQSYTYLRLPTQEEADAAKIAMAAQGIQEWWNENRQILLIGKYTSKGVLDSFLTKEDIDLDALTITFGDDLE